MASSVQSRITGFLIIDRPDLSVEVESTASGVSIVLSLPDGPISIDASFSFDPSAQQTHVYHKDLTTGELSVVDITPSGTLSSMEATGAIDVSDDGSLVAFGSQAEGIQTMFRSQHHFGWRAHETVFVTDLIARGDQAPDQILQAMPFRCLKRPVA